MRLCEGDLKYLKGRNEFISLIFSSGFYANSSVVAESFSSSAKEKRGSNEVQLQCLTTHGFTMQSSLAEVSSMP